ncbi:Dyp-type peroxidase [Streptomyces sp. AC495_CC817]|uniref:Dyp-type peroxidase n=1 Tax=Streptomyces sp. AC495_CC817 TaxID=2823900 RepID=UPI001C261D4C|nr:Dyp-type peroxidase [Streptomyces sp. AC495_CC817]
MPERRVPIAPQQVDAPLTSAAVFLVVTVRDDALAAARAVLAGIDDLVASVGFRHLDGRLSCTVGIGSRVWEPLTGSAPPAELHPFVEMAGATHTAASTPGDLLFHIRAERQDLCFELERLVLEQLGDAVHVEDEVAGFRYFDARDLLGFVDGSANPVGPALPEATLVGAEDSAVAGGSYVVVQKYLHDLSAWQRLSTEEQERIIGHRKADNVELDDAPEGSQQAHKSLATITDAQGEHDILRDNMPFGSPAAGEFGTYFIGYSRRLWVIEKMLERMFIGDPPGLHDRLLDFSTARTGTTFFAPSATFLSGLDEDAG